VGSRQDHNAAPLERELERLLEWLCVEWGFCVPTTDWDRIVTSRAISADEFSAEVLRAKGHVPEYEKKWFRKIRARFIDWFETDAVSADHYQSSEE
jgi:hypothetical protein